MVVDYTFSAQNPIAPAAYCRLEGMHTCLELLMICPDGQKARSICDAASTVLEENELRFNRHDPGSPVWKINNTMEWCKVDDDLYFALELSERMRKMTDGYFDVCALSASMRRPGYETNPTEHEVRRTEEGMMLDFGGFAKGYALELLRKQLSEAGIDKALMNFGNSSTLAIGMHPLGDSWEVKTANTLRTFHLRDSALSISGLSPERKQHIVNPHDPSSRPSGRDIAVTGKSALVCEMLSTALFAAGEADRDNIINKFEGYSYIYG